VSKPVRTIVLLSVGLLAACALVVVLSVRQIALNKAYADLRRRATQPHEGYAVPAFVAKTLTGDTLTVGESVDSMARQVLFVLTTTCPFCKATLPVWARLADSLHRLGTGHIRVIALSLDSVERTRRYATQHDLQFAVATFPNNKLRRLYRAGSVPQTVVLDAGGEVLYARVGRLEAGPVLDSIYGAVGPKPIARSSVAGGSPAARTAKVVAKP
jgi:peroxiredoxin